MTGVQTCAFRSLIARERELCGARAESLAARVAAKEAVLKALGSALEAAGHEVLYDVGKTLPASLRETAKGGCACTPTGCSLSCGIFGS